MNKSTSNNNKSKAAIVSAIVSAIAASSCCIAPLIAMFAGLGGGVANVSWMEAYRPYLITFTVLAIAYAWYVYYNPKDVDDCGCSVQKPKFYQTKSFLMGMTIFAVLSLSFPFYSSIFYNQNNDIESNITLSNNTKTVELNIEGMTCTACENHIIHAVNQLDGILKVDASYEKANATISYDPSIIGISLIEKTIKGTGYSVK